ncbi:unnamed protein product [Schistosoma mattheei]|uniref:Uncharacterized protein n=1 Tax=Schistosoma mattheei TaxID=31246 RepID=A0A183PG18_9TREM|nr:unnamed protein product [Schistosoma mattheei]
MVVPNHLTKNNIISQSNSLMNNRFCRNSADSLMERENLERNLSDAQKKCHTMDTSERDMRNLILRAEEDKKRLAQRIEKLTANGIVLL